MQQNLFLSVLRVAGATYGRNAFTVVTASMAVQLGAIAVGLAAINQFKLSGVLVLVLLQVMAAQMTIGMMTYVVLGERTGTGVLAPGELLRKVAPKLPLLLATAFLVGILMFVGAVFFLVGALYAALATALAAPIAMSEGVGPWEAIKRSRSLVIQAAGTTLLIVMSANLLGVLVDAIVSNASDVPPPMEVSLIFNAVVASVVAPLSALMIVELYSRLAQYGPLAFAGMQQTTASLASTAPTMGTGAWVPVPAMAAAAPVATPAPSPYGAPAMPAMQAYAPSAPAAHAPQAPLGYGQQPGAPAYPQAYGQPMAPAQAHATHAAPAPATYAPPPVQAYGAPAPAASYPPAQPAYAPPAQQAYAPPAPQAYGAPPQAPAPTQYTPPQREHSVAPPGMG